MRPLKEQISEINQNKRKHHRHARLQSVLSLGVVFWIFYVLLLPASTLSKPVYCGLEEHVHTEDCYRYELICTKGEALAGDVEALSGADEAMDPAEDHIATLADDHIATPGDFIEPAKTGSTATPGDFDADETKGHVHTAACYRKVLVCGLEEHTHNLGCYVDPEAAEDGDQAELTELLPRFENGDYPDSYAYLAALADFQTGYQESVTNYRYDIDEDGGEEVHGYTMYGAWGEEPYTEDWGAFFAGFNIEYAGLETETFDSDVLVWTDNLKEAELYRPIEDYLEDGIGSLFDGDTVLPLIPGDLVILDTDDDFDPDAVGILTSFHPDKERITLVRGAVDGRVREERYDLWDLGLLGFARLPETEEAIERNRLYGKADVTDDGDPEAAEDPEAAGDPEDAETGADTDPDASEASVILRAALEDSEILLYAGEDAGIPEGAVLKAEPIISGSEYEIYKAEALTACGEENAKLLSIQDLTIRDAAGSEIEPAAQVQMELRLTESLPAGARVYALHFPSAGPYAAKPETESSIPSAKTAGSLARARSMHALSASLDAHPRASADYLEPELIPVDYTDDRLQFTADSFSVYAFIYTVDFEYAQDGTLYSFSLSGGGDVWLSLLLERLHLDIRLEEIAEVSFTNDQLVSVTRAEEKGDWLLASLQSFDTIETLRILMKDGSEIFIRVTDPELGVKTFTLDKVVDGTAPFDGDDERGNDSSDQNGRIRSFDSIIYNTSVEVQGASEDGGDVGDLIYEFTVPNDRELELDIATMGLTLKDENQPVVTGDQKTYTFVKSGVRLTGSIATPIYLKAGNKTEGFQIQPEIRVSVVSGEQTSAPVSIGEVPAVTVTSAPAYNVQLDLVKELSGVVTGNYDAGLGPEGAASEAGMVSKYAFAVQMRKAEANKGLKGIELPDKDNPITFDIDLSSSYTKIGGEDVDLTESGFPLRLLHVEPNGGSTVTDGNLPASYAVDDPADGHTNVLRDLDGSRIVYQNGNVTITQDGQKLHVTITGFDTSLDAFPTEGVTGASYLNSAGELAIGNICTYRFDLLQPTTIQNGGETTTLGQYMREENGTVHVHAEATNLSMKSETGAGVTQETILTDNEKSTNRLLTGGDALYNHQIFFSSGGNVTSGTDGNAEGNKNNGSDSAVLGSEVWITAVFDEANVGTDNIGNRAVAYDQLIKFDNLALEPAADANQRWNGAGHNGDWETIKVLFVGKTGGWDHDGREPWEEGYDQQMKNAAENSEFLDYYDSLEALKADGRECVGLLLQYRGCSVTTTEDKVGVGFQFPMRVKDDLRLLDHKIGDALCGSYMLTMHTYVWNIAGLESRGITVPDNGDQNNPYTKYANFARASSSAALFDYRLAQPDSEVSWDLYYVKDTYDESGYRGDGSAGFLWGDTIYIVPYTATVNKQVAQTSGDDPKDTFNLDTNQNRVDFRITGLLRFSQETSVGMPAGMTTTVTLYDYLPEGLTYEPGSARYGADYIFEESSNSGEAKGIITEGTAITPAIQENYEINGIKYTRLTFTIPDVPVSDGGQVPTLYYSCAIGNAENNQQFTNSVAIQTNEDKRTPRLRDGNLAEAGFRVIRSSSFYILKSGTGSLELDGEASFELHVHNGTTEARQNVLAIDFLPDTEGSYRITGLRLSKTALGSVSEDRNIQVFYTSDESLLQSAVKDNGRYVLAGDTTITGWTEAAKQDQGEYYTFEVSGWPKAIAYVDSSLPGHSDAMLTLGYQAEYGRTGESLANVFSTGNVYTQARADVYSRSLEGIAWFDVDRNGRMDVGEQRLGGITVSLYRYQEDGTLQTDPVMITTTDADGHYAFGVPDDIPEGYSFEGNILRAGRYAILFSGSGLDSFIDVTSKMAPDVADAVNSKADRSDTVAMGAIIPDVRMMTIDEMKADPETASEHKHTVLYQNAGFIMGYELPSTGGRGSRAYHAAGTMLVLCALGLAYRKKSTG